MLAKRLPDVMSDGRAWQRRGIVLDLETAPDAHACVLSRRRRGAPLGSPLHEVVSASALCFAEAGDGSLDGLALRTWHRDDYREDDILANLEMELAVVVGDGGDVVTFNGVAHDLPTLRRRQLRWWMCEAASVERLWKGDAVCTDVMLALSHGGEARWPTLVDACASVGFSLYGPNGVGRSSTIPHEAEKGELDVIGTFILYLYMLAGGRRSSEPLRRGLPLLGDYLRRVADVRPHLARLAHSRLLAPDACAWGAGPAAPTAQALGAVAGRIGGDGDH